ncbi:CPBP family intramembrane glutamic endopeptidase [Telmatobacter bradus]|uniref:CPBP family intramembrane glutamic endopeptidase n=1 Tax=Telmatobacter bradus TaxID=474953 RepID=UPI003B42897B
MQSEEQSALLAGNSAAPSLTPEPESPASPESFAAGQQLEESPAALPPQPAPLSTPVEPGKIEKLAAAVFVGEDGLRSGWSILLFTVLMGIVSGVLGAFFVGLHLLNLKQPPGLRSMFFGELLQVLGIAAAAAAVALIERRKGNLLAYNLIGPRRTKRFFAGLGWGFVALSVLVGALKAGGWIALTGSGLAAPQILQYAALWGLTFLLVGCVEEGMVRCFLLSTLTRGLNLWWALGLQAAMCAFLAFCVKGGSVWGVYAIALLGLAPCIWLHLKKAESAGFWQAAWVTSTLFGLMHTGNGGENWIGIFQAAAVGFIFCVSVRLTGSAWWAIGFHAAWDWTETFFYGTADSGIPAHGSFLVAKPFGNAFWSGGADGPEGSPLCMIPILLALVVLVAFDRGQRAEFRELKAASPL